MRHQRWIDVPSEQINETVARRFITGDSVTASHIVINLQDPSTYIKQLKIQKPPRLYVHF